MKTVTKSKVWMCLCSVMFLVTQFGSGLKAQTVYDIFPNVESAIENRYSPAGSGPLLCQLMLRSDTLRSRGMLPGSLEGISFRVLRAQPQVLNRLIIRIAQIRDTLATTLIPQDSLYQVLDSMIAWADTGWLPIRFHQSFLWDGSRSVFIQICVLGDSAMQDSVLGATPLYSPSYVSVSGNTNCQISGGFIIHSFAPGLRMHATPFPPDCSAYTAPGSIREGLPNEGVLLRWHQSSGIGEASAYRVFLDTMNPPLAVLGIQSASDTFLHTGLLPEQTTFYWKVLPENAGGSALHCMIDSFRTGPAYCALQPMFSGGIKFHKLMWHSDTIATTDVCGGYALSTDTLVLYAGDSLRVRVSTGSCQAYRSYFASMGLDANADGDFNDSGEMIFQSGEIQDTLFSFSALIPQSTTTGYTRLRIGLQELSSLQSLCGNYTYGDVQDILIRILPPPPPNCIQGIQSNLSIMQTVCPDSQLFEIGHISGVCNGALFLVDTFSDFISSDTIFMNNSPQQILSLPLQIGTRYYYRILPLGPGGSAVHCPIDSFVTAMDYCSDTACVLTGVQPIDGTTHVYPSAVALSWTLPIGRPVDSIQVRADIQDPPEQILLPWASAALSSTVFNWPEADTLLYWKVDIKDANGRIRHCRNSYSFHTLPDVCLPIIDGGNHHGDYISYIAIDSFQRYSGAVQHPQYYERWDSTIPEVHAGSVCSLRVSPGTYPSGNSIAAWIDYNKDSQWSSSEKLGEVMVNAPMPASEVIVFTVPACSDTGYTILRIREVWGVSGIDPCDAYPYGETEEYIIKILPNVPEVPQCPVAHFPSGFVDTISAHQVELQWQESQSGACAQAFRVYVGTNHPPTNVLNGVSSLQRNLHTLFQLQGNTHYYWRIEPVNAVGANAQCGVQQFKTCPIVPAPAWRPAEGVTCNRFTLRWDTVAGALGYQIQVSTDSLFTQLLFPDSTSYLTQSDRKAFSGFQSGVQYYCRMRSYSACDTGLFGTVLAVNTVSVPAVPEWNTPALPGCHAIQVRWHAATGALNYQLDVSEEALFESYLSGYQQRNMTPTQLWIPGLRPSRPYYARVRAGNTCGYSGWSTVLAHTTGRDTWTGIQSSWHHPSNWCSGYVPDSLTNVYIPGNRQHMPVISQAATVADIEIGAGAVLTHASADTFRVWGEWRNHGRYQSGMSTLAFCGHSPQMIYGQDTLRHMLVRNPSGVTIDTSARLTLRGYYTPVLGPLFTQGNLQFLVDTNVQAGVLKELSPTARTVGSVRLFHQYNRVSGPRYICSPLIDISYGDWWSAHSQNPSLWQYAEPALGPRDAGFQEIGNHYDTFSVGRGYWANVPANNSIQLSGHLQEGLVQIPVSFTVDPNNRSASGWNLVGNPYLCPIDWDAQAGIIRPNISTSIFFLDPKTGLQATYNNGVGTLGATSVIPPGQGFWVKAFADHPQLIFDERCKTAASGKLFRNPTIEAQLRFQLHRNQSLWDEAVYVRRAGTTSAFEAAYDAEFFEAIPVGENKHPRIWIEGMDSLAYTIYNSADLDFCKVCLQVPTAGEWAVHMQALGATQDYLVTDRFHKEQSLSSPYTFHAEFPGVYCPLILSPSDGSNTKRDIARVMRIAPNPASNTEDIQIMVSGFEDATGTLSISDLQGHILWVQAFRGANLRIPVNTLTIDGVYILEYRQNAIREVGKLMISNLK